MIAACGGEPDGYGVVVFGTPTVYNLTTEDVVFTPAIEYEEDRDAGPTIDWVVSIAGGQDLMRGSSVADRRRPEILDSTGPQQWQADEVSVSAPRMMWAGFRIAVFLDPESKLSAPGANEPDRRAYVDVRR